MARRVIFNADDLGASEGINRGIIEAHARGVVTSASLMTAGPAAAEAAVLARRHPALAVGLHWDVWGEDEREFDLDDEGAVRRELERQLDDFRALMDRPPTHLDSHKHAHQEGAAPDVFDQAGAQLGVPVRGQGGVRYLGGFYAQWEWQVTELQYVSVEFLQELLAAEAVSEWTEIGCHPGYRSPGFSSVYDQEREVELRTLTDPRVRGTITELGLELVSYADYQARHEAAT
ncbi:MAG: carbohydrate deacetylase [Solirubrobacteraceae bacterium]